MGKYAREYKRHAWKAGIHFWEELWPHVTESQIYKGDPRTCTIFVPAWGSNWGSSGVFPVIKIHCNCGLSGVYATCINCSLNVKINMRKMLHSVQGSWAHFFMHVWSAKNPNLSTGPIQGLRSPLYICMCLMYILKVVQMISVGKGMCIQHCEKCIIKF